MNVINQAAPRTGYILLIGFFILVGCKTKAPVPLMPKASFRLANPTCTAPCDPGITNLSQYAVSYRWDFGDGGTSTFETPQHTYTKGGSFAIKLTVTGEENQQSDTTITISLQSPTPVAAFTVQNNNCTAACEIGFTNQSTYGNTYAWNFGDGGTSADANPKHTYAKGGTYTVKLTANGDQSKSGSATQTVTIKDAPPVANFLVQNDNCIAPCTVGLQNQSTNATSYSWRILTSYSGTTPLYRTATDVSPSQLYSVVSPLINGGRLGYTAELTATGPGGTATVRKAVTIRPPAPTAIFTYQFISRTDGTYVQLINQSSNATSYKWYYGTNQTSTLETPPAYKYIGAQGVTLDAFNETSTSRRQIVVEVPLPIIK